MLRSSDLIKIPRERSTTNLAVTIVGNGAVFDAGGKGVFFCVDVTGALVMSNVILRNGNSSANAGGAIFVEGTAT
jgi:predicted outer membrane repeat protein